MKWEQDRTLFRPDPKIQVVGGGGRKPGMTMGATARAQSASPSDDDEPQISMTDRVREAARSASRRKGLSAIMILIGIALTVVAAMLAPRTYGVEGRILVTRTQTLGGAAGAAAFPQTGDEQKALAKEYVEQVMARDNIIAIVQQTKLVDRWDSMRQPHRRLIDKMNEKLGTPMPTDDQKFEALVRMIEARLRVDVDATTVTFGLDWTEPESARDIVQAAVDNFQKKRFQVEVGVLPEQLRATQQKVDEKRKQVGDLFEKWQAAEAAKNPTKPGTRMVATTREIAVVEAGGDPAVAKKLELVRADIAAREEGKKQRLMELNNKLSEMQATYAPGHPDMIALKANIASTQQDPPELQSLRAQERSLAAEYEASKNRPAGTKKETVMVAQPGQTDTGVPITPRSAEDLKGMYELARTQYGEMQYELEKKKAEQQSAELTFKNRYSVTKPPEVPGAPKKPVSLIAGIVGLLATIAFALFVASLADRFSGVFFEPRDVRDRLGLPVFANMRW